MYLIVSVNNVVVVVVVVVVLFCFSSFTFSITYLTNQRMFYKNSGYFFVTNAEKLSKSTQIARVHFC